MTRFGLLQSSPIAGIEKKNFKDMSHEKSWDISLTHSWQYFLHRFTNRQDVPGELYTVHRALRGNMCAVSHWQHSRVTNNEIKASVHPTEVAGCWKTPWTAEMLLPSRWSWNWIRHWDAEGWLICVKSCASPWEDPLHPMERARLVREETVGSCQHFRFINRDLGDKNSDST